MTSNDLIARVEGATAESAERDELGIAINEALDIASYITDDGDPTQSINAALTLIPGGRRMSVQQRRSYEPFWVSFMVDGSTEYDATGRAKTLALAICAAALRSRAGGEHGSTSPEQNQ